MNANVQADLEAEVQRLKGQLDYAIRLNRELDAEKEGLALSMKKEKKKAEEKEEGAAAAVAQLSAVEAEAQRWHRACDAAQDEVKQLNANVQGIKALAQQQVAQAEARGACSRRLACTSSLNLCAATN